MTAQFGAKFSPAKIAAFGLALVAAGLAGMLVIGVDSSWAAILPGLLVTSVGAGLFNPTGSALALNALPDEQSGLAVGANDTFRQAGVAVGSAPLRTLVPPGAALSGDPPAVVPRLHPAPRLTPTNAPRCATAPAWLLPPPP